MLREARHRPCCTRSRTGRARDRKQVCGCHRLGGDVRKLGSQRQLCTQLALSCGSACCLPGGDTVAAQGPHTGSSSGALGFRRGACFPVVSPCGRWHSEQQRAGVLQVWVWTSEPAPALRTARQGSSALRSSGKFSRLRPSLPGRRARGGGHPAALEKSRGGPGGACWHAGPALLCLDATPHLPK